MFCASFSGGSDGKESACNARDPGSVPGWGRSPGEGNGNGLQYFDHLMQRTDSLEKVLMMGKIESRRRRLDGITDSMDMSLGEFREL